MPFKNVETETNCGMCNYGKTSCTGCGGRGWTFYTIFSTDKIACAYCRSGQVNCNKCGGTGRIKTRTSTYERTPPQTRKEKTEEIKEVKKVEEKNEEEIIRKEVEEWRRNYELKKAAEKTSQSLAEIFRRNREDLEKTRREEQMKKDEQRQIEKQKEQKERELYLKASRYLPYKDSRDGSSYLSHVGINTLLRLKYEILNEITCSYWRYDGVGRNEAARILDDAIRKENQEKLVESSTELFTHFKTHLISPDTFKRCRSYEEYEYPQIYRMKRLIDDFESWVRENVSNKRIDIKVLTGWMMDKGYEHIANYKHLEDFSKELCKKGYDIPTMTEVEYMAILQTRLENEQKHAVKAQGIRR